MFLIVDVDVVVVLIQRKIRQGKHYQQHQDVTVTANLVDKHIGHANGRTVYWAKYEYWFHNKKHFIYASDNYFQKPFRQNYEYSFHVGDFSNTIEVVVNSRNGKHIKSQSVRNSQYMQYLAFAIMVVVLFFIFLHNL